MLTKEDLKIGQYVKYIYGTYCEIIESINSQYAYTNMKNRIYPKDYKYYFALTEQEAKGHIVYSLNSELKDLLANLKDFEKEVFNLSNLPYFTVDTEEIENDLKDIMDRFEEVLKELK